MNPKDYLEKSGELDTNYDNVQVRLNETQFNLKLMHGALGLAGESGEVVDLIKKSLIFGKPLDEAKLKSECGDVLWYMGILLRAMNCTFEDIMEINMKKLDARYPRGFTENCALERKDEK